MVSSFLKKGGFSLLEGTVVVSMIACLMSVMIPSYLDRINKARYEKTVNELTAITQAAIDYSVSKGSWPAGIGQLAPRFISTVPPSPFGTIYQISCVNDMVTASVLIPTGIAQKEPQGPLLFIQTQGDQDQIDVSQTVHNALTARLHYDLKYVY